MRMPCYSKVCTHVSNDKYDEEEVLRAIGAAGVEKEQLLKQCVTQSLEDSERESQLELPAEQPSLKGQIRPMGSVFRLEEEPISEFSLGDPLLAAPPMSLKPKAPAPGMGNPQEPASQKSTNLDEGRKFLDAITSYTKSMSPRSKATPTSLGYFQNPAYLERVGKEVARIAEKYQRFPKGSIKTRIEYLSAMLREQPDLLQPELLMSSSAEGSSARTGLGRGIDACKSSSPFRPFDDWGLPRLLKHLSNIKDFLDYCGLF